jgi:deoxycytidine triphosphate deaminase
MLSDKNITDLINEVNLIENHDPDNLSNSGYSLRVGSIFQPKSGFEELKPNNNLGRRDYWVIGPTECLIVKTAEKLNIPNGYSAYYAPLNRLAQKGVMLLNASVVEPGYSGSLSCFLVNFSSHDVEIIKDEDIAKITFHKLDSMSANFLPNKIDDKKYRLELSKSARLFEKTFLGVSGIEERATKAATNSVKNSLILAGVGLAFLLIFAQLEPIISKFIWEKLGVITTSRRVDEIKLNNELRDTKNELQVIKKGMKDTEDITELRDKVLLLEKKIELIEKTKSTRE